MIETEKSKTLQELFEVRDKYETLITEHFINRIYKLKKESKEFKELINK